MKLHQADVDPRAEMRMLLSELRREMKGYHKKQEQYSETSTKKFDDMQKKLDVVIFELRGLRCQINKIHDGWSTKEWISDIISAIFRWPRL